MICAVPCHQRGKLRGEQGCGVALDAFDQLRADQRRRDRQAMAAAAGIGAKRRQRGLVGRSKPDEMAAALAASPLRHRHRDRQQEFAVREAEHHPLEHQFVQLRRQLMRLDHAAPGDISGVARAQGRGQSWPRTVECSPSAPTSRSASAREPSAKIAGHAVRMLLEPGQRLAAGIERVRQRLPQRPPDARPGAGDGADRQARG